MGTLNQIRQHIAATLSGIRALFAFLGSEFERGARVQAVTDLRVATSGGRPTTTA